PVKWLDRQIELIRPQDNCNAGALFYGYVLPWEEEYKQNSWHCPKAR
ncbi:unnamed protein product, partial [marine sediment metagenome]